MEARSKPSSHSSVTTMRSPVRAASTASSFSDRAWMSGDTKSKRQHDRGLIGAFFPLFYGQSRSCIQRILQDGEAICVKNEKIGGKNGLIACCSNDYFQVYATKIY